MAHKISEIKIGDKATAIDAYLNQKATGSGLVSSYWKFSTTGSTDIDFLNKHPSVRKITLVFCSACNITVVGFAAFMTGAALIDGVDYLYRKAVSGDGAIRITNEKAVECFKRISEGSRVDVEAGEKKGEIKLEVGGSGKNLSAQADVAARALEAWTQAVIPSNLKSSLPGLFALAKAAIRDVKKSYYFNDKLKTASQKEDFLEAARAAFSREIARYLVQIVVKEKKLPGGLQEIVKLYNDHGLVNDEQTVLDTLKAALKSTTTKGAREKAVKKLDDFIAQTRVKGVEEAVKQSAKQVERHRKLQGKIAQFEVDEQKMLAKEEKLVVKINKQIKNVVGKEGFDALEIDGEMSLSEIRANVAKAKARASSEIRKLIGLTYAKLEKIHERKKGLEEARKEIGRVANSPKTAVQVKHEFAHYANEWKQLLLGTNPMLTSPTTDGAPNARGFSHRREPIRRDYRNSVDDFLRRGRESNDLREPVDLIKSRDRRSGRSSLDGVKPRSDIRSDDRAGDSTTSKSTGRGSTGGAPIDRREDFGHLGDRKEERRNLGSGAATKIAGGAGRGNTGGAPTSLSGGGAGSSTQIGGGANLGNTGGAPTSLSGGGANLGNTGGVIKIDAGAGRGNTGGGPTSLSGGGAGSSKWQNIHRLLADENTGGAPTGLSGDPARIGGAGFGDAAGDTTTVKNEDTSKTPYNKKDKTVTDLDTYATLPPIKFKRVTSSGAESPKPTVSGEDAAETLKKDDLNDMWDELAGDISQASNNTKNMGNVSTTLYDTGDSGVTNKDNLYSGVISKDSPYSGIINQDNPFYYAHASANSEVPSGGAGNLVGKTDGEANPENIAEGSVLQIENLDVPIKDVHASDSDDDGDNIIFDIVDPNARSSGAPVVDTARSLTLNDENRGVPTPVIVKSESTNVAQNSEEQHGLVSYDVRNTTSSQTSEVEARVNTASSLNMNDPTVGVLPQVIVQDEPTNVAQNSEEQQILAGKAVEAFSQAVETTPGEKEQENLEEIKRLTSETDRLTTKMNEFKSELGEIADRNHQKLTDKKNDLENELREIADQYRQKLTEIASDALDIETNQESMDNVSEELKNFRETANQIIADIEGKSSQLEATQDENERNKLLGDFLKLATQLKQVEQTIKGLEFASTQAIDKNILLSSHKQQCEDDLTKIQSLLLSKEAEKVLIEASLDEIEAKLQTLTAQQKSTQNSDPALTINSVNSSSTTVSDNVKEEEISNVVVNVEIPGNLDTSTESSSTTQQPKQSSQSLKGHAKPHSEEMKKKVSHLASKLVLTAPNSAKVKKVSATAKSDGSEKQAPVASTSSQDTQISYQEMLKSKPPGPQGKKLPGSQAKKKSNSTTSTATVDKPVSFAEPIVFDNIFMNKVIESGAIAKPEKKDPIVRFQQLCGNLSITIETQQRHADSINQSLEESTDFNKSRFGEDFLREEIAKDVDFYGQLEKGAIDEKERIKQEMRQLVNGLKDEESKLSMIGPIVEAKSQEQSEIRNILEERKVDENDPKSQEILKELRPLINQNNRLEEECNFLMSLLPNSGNEDSVVDGSGVQIFIDDSGMSQSLPSLVQKDGNDGRLTHSSPSSFGSGDTDATADVTSGEATFTSDVKITMKAHDPSTKQAEGESVDADSEPHSESTPDMGPVFNFVYNGAPAEQGELITFTVFTGPDLTVKVPNNPVGKDASKKADESLKEVVVTSENVTPPSSPTKPKTSPSLGSSKSSDVRRFFNDALAPVVMEMEKGDQVVNDPVLVSVNQRLQTTPSTGATPSPQKERTLSNLYGLWGD
jgi:hypothetical protein